MKNHIENDRNRLSFRWADSISARSDSHATLAAELPKSTVATTGGSWVEQEMDGISKTGWWFGPFFIFHIFP